MRLLGERRVVEHATIRRGILQEHAEDAFVQLEGVVVADDDLDAQRPGTRLDHIDRLRVAELRDEENVGLALRLDVGQVERFTRRGRLVEERCVRDLHPGEIHDHGLVVEKRLQPSLGNLGLVGRVLGVPTGVLHDVSENHTGCVGVAVAHPQIRPAHAVGARKLAKSREQGRLGDGLGKREHPVHADRGRDDVPDQ